jgi:hypothetical protein
MTGNFMCQLGQAMVSRCSIKHHPHVAVKAFFQMSLTLKFEESRLSFSTVVEVLT